MKKSKKAANKNICPYCHADLEGELIFDTFKRMRDAGEQYYAGMTDKQILNKVVSSYGPHDSRWKRQIGIEYQGNYDGVLRWQCPDCKGTWDRFKNDSQMAHYYRNLPQNVIPTL